jgi:NAD(P)-dependent dehydrogenase (short-subunit alcohol dehydrogenase family)
MGRLAGKVAVVLPGTFGIGHEVARGLAAEGAKVAVLGLSEANGRKTADALVAAGAEAMFVRADPIVDADVKAACDAVRRHWGFIDIAVGTPDYHPLALCHETAADDFDLAQRFNVRSLLLLAKHTIPWMVEEGTGGSVVFLTSIYGLVSGSVSAAYEMSKSMAIALTKALGERYAPRRVRVNCIAAGHVRHRERGLAWEFGDDTVRDDAEARRLGEFYPAGRIAEPEEIVGAAIFLASADASFVNAAVLPVDGAFTAR